MNVNRRQFGTMVGCVALMPLATGCGRTTVIALITVVDNAVTSILDDVGDTALATMIQSDITVLNAAIAGWTSGTITQEVVEAINILVANLDKVPLDSFVTTLISIALTALASILTASGGNVIQQGAQIKQFNHRLLVDILDTPRKFAIAWNKGVDLCALPASKKVSVPLF